MWVWKLCLKAMDRDGPMMAVCVCVCVCVCTRPVRPHGQQGLACEPYIGAVKKGRRATDIDSMLRVCVWDVVI